MEKRVGTQLNVAGSRIELILLACVVPLWTFDYSGINYLVGVRLITKRSEPCWNRFQS
jgi:hypothetical protein